eukprot:925245-Pelagomonas_calceolata.AAC.2
MHARDLGSMLMCPGSGATSMAVYVKLYKGFQHVLTSYDYQELPEGLGSKACSKTMSSVHMYTLLPPTSISNPGTPSGSAAAAGKHQHVLGQSG